MRTIGKHRPQGSPEGDYEAKCDYCGVHWYRSDLRRDGAGNLVCPDHDHGEDVVTLDRMVAEDGRNYRQRFLRQDSGTDNI